MKIINLLEYAEMKNKQKIERSEIARILFDEEDEIRYPDCEKHFLWLVDRVSSGKCELLLPNAFNKKNEHLSEWKMRLEDKRYMCAFFKSPQVRYNVFYSKSLRPSETGGINEVAYAVVPLETVYTLRQIIDDYGLPKLTSLVKNKEMLYFTN